MNSKHCDIRCKQRGIPVIIIDWLIDYGRVVRSYGADVYYLDKKGRRRLKREIGTIAYKRMNDLLNSFLVMSDDGTIVTVGKRYKRIKH